jgi:hypothetical protein
MADNDSILSHEDSDDAGSLVDFIVEDEETDTEPETKRARVETDDDSDGIKTLEEEAKQFVGEVQGTVVGGRVLRSRDAEKVEARKPKDEYLERFGRAELLKLEEKDTKKDIIAFLKTLEAEWRQKYEEAGNTWPSLNMRMSLEAVREKYDHVKQFADLPDSDDEGEEEIDDDDEVEDDEVESEEEADDDAEEESDDDGAEVDDEDVDDIVSESEDSEEV